jgi:hypothetical protein
MPLASRLSAQAPGIWLLERRTEHGVVILVTTGPSTHRLRHRGLSTQQLAENAVRLPHCGI